MNTTIRKNATKRIQEILDNSILIREVHIDDMGDTNQAVTTDMVMSAGREYQFGRVYISDNGVLNLNIHRNWFFVAYPSVEVAKACLTSVTFEKYFPGAA